ncbi:MAG: PAS domain S-box protein [Bacillota bacterium]|nr:PAS domain S-box protein [Bacillota bacterium]
MLPEELGTSGNCRMFIDNMNEAVAYCKAVYNQTAIPSDFTVIDFNKSLYKLTGFNKDTVLGRKVSEILSESEKGLSFLKFLLEIVSSGKNSEYQYYSGRFKKWISISVYDVNNGYYYFTIHDITELKHQFNLLRRTLDLSPNLIVATDLVGNIIDCNNRVLEVFGFTSKDEAVRSNALNLIVKEQREKARQYMLSGLTVETLDDERFIFQGKDGNFPGEMSVSLIKDTKGLPVGYMGIARNTDESDKMQEDLRKLTREYSIIFNGTQDSIFLVEATDQNTFRYSRINKSFEAVTGLTADRICGRTPYEVFGEVGKEFELKYMSCVREKKPISYQGNILLPTGLKFIHTTLSPIIRNKHVVNLVGSMRDITEIKQAQDSLAEEKELLKVTLQSIGDAVITTDTKGCITLINKTAQELTGWSQEEAIDKPLNQVFFVIDERTGLTAENPVGKVLKEGNVVGLANHTALVSKDGNIVSIADSAAPIKDKTGRILGVVLVFRDVTEINRTQNALKASEEKLKNSSEKLKTLFGFSPNPIIVTDKNGIIFDCNQEVLRLLEYSSKKELLRKSILDIIVPEEYDILKSKILELFKNGMVKNSEYTVCTKNNRKLIVQSSSSLIRNSSGQPDSIIVIAEDITDRKQAEAEIKYLSYHDKLTGLYNRVCFENELDRLDTERQLPISLIIGDLNGLKLTNDVFGHSEGDKLLQKVAHILKGSCRKEDIIARWGGDEFAIILPKTENSKAIEICSRVIDQCDIAEKDPIQPSIALGYATKYDGSVDIQQTLKEAENWMYRHKLLDNRSVRSTIISSLEKTLFEKSIETEEHAQRIRIISTKLGKAMGLSETELDELSLLSLLHDIGKIAISDSILTKPGPLTSEEWEEMKKHPEIGYRIAESSQDLAHIAEFILSHHERWDGTGYPRGLKGYEIPKLARIISIIDAYDVMTHIRPYKGIISHEDAVREIRRCQGKQFDPDISELFVNIIDGSDC